MRTEDRYLLSKWSPIRPTQNREDLSSKVRFVPNTQDIQFPEPSDTVRLATWNTGRMLQEEEPKAWKAAELVIRGVKPGIIGIQEGPSLDRLEKFLQIQQLAETYRYTFAIKGNDRFHDLGLISRYPIREACTHRDVRFPLSEKKNTPVFLSRDVLEIAVQLTPIFKMTVVIIHLSRHSAYQDAEITYVREVVRKTDGATVLLGDCNALPDSRAISRLKRVKHLQDGAHYSDLHPQSRQGELFARRLDHILSKELEHVPRSTKIWALGTYLKQVGLICKKEFDPHLPLSTDIKI